MRAERDRTTEPLLKPGRRRKMVGVSMGLEEPVDRYPLGTHMVGDRFGRPGRRPSRRGSIVEHAVDHRAAHGQGVVDDIADRRGRGVEKALYHRSEEHTSELQSLMRISYAVICLKKHRQYT